MSTSKPTPGPFAIGISADKTPLITCAAGMGIAFVCMRRHELSRAAKVEETEANTRLIFDALNVHAETGLTPRELLAQRDELLENLIGCMEALSSHVPDCIEVECARAAIAKTKEPK